MKISISVNKIMRLLMAVVIFLTTCGVLVVYGKYSLGHERLLGFSYLMNLDGEANIPSWYQSISLLWVACLLAVISCYKKETRDGYAFQWQILSAVFMWMSLDEAVSIHEKSIEPLRHAFHASGVFYFAWVIPAIILVVAFGLFYLRFLRHLPGRSRNLIIAAAFLYVGGALGMELIGGKIASSVNGVDKITYALETIMEELFEMTGILVFTYALLDYIRSYIPLKEAQIEIR